MDRATTAVSHATSVTLSLFFVPCTDSGIFYHTAVAADSTTKASAISNRISAAQSLSGVQIESTTPVLFVH